MVTIGSTGFTLILAGLIFFFGRRKWVTLDEDLNPRYFGLMMLVSGAALLIYGYYDSALDALI